MKMRPLPELDLARIAPMPRDQKRRALEQMKLGRPPYSYDPMRQSALDILNIEPGPLGAGARTPWHVIEADVRRRAKTADEADANLRVAEGLYSFADANHLRGRRHEFFPLAIGTSEKVTYWFQAVLAVGEKALVPFIDPRRAKKLSAEARRFVFSVMHERIRVADPDFAHVGLAIIQFAAPDEGSRVPQLFTDDGLELLEFDALDAMVRETYELWREVLEEREAETRRRAGGTRGPLI